jgi:hypothetical protein
MEKQPGLNPSSLLLPALVGACSPSRLGRPRSPGPANSRARAAPSPLPRASQTSSLAQSPLYPLSLPFPLAHWRHDPTCHLHLPPRDDDANTTSPHRLPLPPQAHNPAAAPPKQLRMSPTCEPPLSLVPFRAIPIPSAKPIDTRACRHDTALAPTSLWPHEDEHEP